MSVDFYNAISLESMVYASLVGGGNIPHYIEGEDLLEALARLRHAQYSSLQRRVDNEQLSSLGGVTLPLDWRGLAAPVHVSQTLQLTFPLQ